MSSSYTCFSVKLRASTNLYIYIYTCAGCFGRSLIISHAKRNFLSKVPESLKAKLVERLRLFSQEKQSSGT